MQIRVETVFVPFYAHQLYGDTTSIKKERRKRGRKEGKNGKNENSKWFTTQMTIVHVHVIEEIYATCIQKYI